VILQSISPGSLRLREALSRLLEDGIRVVHLLDGAPVPGISSVEIDNELGGYLAGRYLLELGHTQILFIADDRPERRWPRRFSLQRYAGLQRAYDERNLARSADLIVYENSQYHGYEATLEALDRGSRFTAVFAYSDQSAIGALIALKERGISVPQGCSVVGFADSTFTQGFMRPSLTSVHLPFDRVGAEAIRLVLEPGAPLGKRVLVEPTLIVRESTLKLAETSIGGK
jgi:LacI family transcriptional regulator